MVGIRTRETTLSFGASGGRGLRNLVADDECAAMLAIAQVGLLTHIVLRVGYVMGCPYMLYRGVQRKLMETLEFDARTRLRRGQLGCNVIPSRYAYFMRFILSLVLRIY